MKVPLGGDAGVVMHFFSMLHVVGSQQGLLMEWSTSKMSKK